jgi:hypothetical protein
MQFLCKLQKKNHNTFIQIADQFAYLLLEKKTLYVGKRNCTQKKNRELFSNCPVSSKSTHECTYFILSIFLHSRVLFRPFWVCLFTLLSVTTTLMSMTNKKQTEPHLLMVVFTSILSNRLQCPNGCKICIIKKKKLSFITLKSAFHILINVIFTLIS